MSVIDNWTALNDDGGHNGTCAIVLPGRGGSALDIGYPYAAKSGLDDTLIIAVTPKNYEWYPQPHGPENQKSAVNGLGKAVESIHALMMEIESRYGIHSEKIFLIGFSAGGVVAAECACKLDRQIGAAAIHCGAILEPESIPSARSPDTPILWVHYKDDPVFSWQNRYLPAKKALKSKGYYLRTLERDTGGHTLRAKDIAVMGRFLKKEFYPGGLPKGTSSTEVLQ